MITLSARACIDAPPQVVWAQLAELEGISAMGSFNSASSMHRCSIARNRRRADM